MADPKLPEDVLEVARKVSSELHARALTVLLEVVHGKRDMYDGSDVRIEKDALVIARALLAERQRCAEKVCPWCREKRERDGTLHLVNQYTEALGLRDERTTKLCIAVEVGILGASDPAEQSERKS